MPENVRNRRTSVRRAAAGAADAVDDLTTASPPVEILALAPEANGRIVYAPTAPPSPALSGAAVIVLKAHIRNNGDDDVRLNRVTVTFPIGGGDGVALPEIYDAADIAAGELDTVFDTDDPLGRVIQTGGSLWLPLQKRKDNKTLNIVLGSPAPVGISVSFRFAGYDQEITVTRPLAAHVNQNGTAEGSYLYPFWARDLRRGEFWTGATGGIKSHHKNDERFAYDTTCSGFSALTGEWSSRLPGTSGADNRDYRVFARPVYAMADGTVLSITNDRKDNDPNCKEGNEGENQITIRHGDERVAYLHLMRGSVHPQLAVGDSVKAGQFLALAGNSGNSTEPHFHMHAVGQDGHPRPILFRGAWVADVDQIDIGDFTGPWVRLDKDALPIRSVGNGDLALVWPSRETPRRIDRQSDSGEQGTEVDFLDATTLGPNRIVTAGQGSADKRLQLVSWAVNNDSVVRLGDSGKLGSAVQALSLTGVSANRVVTAVKTEGGRLKVINWSVLGEGTTFERLGDSGSQGGESQEGLVLGMGAIATTPQLDQVAAAHLGGGLVATAITTDHGALRVLMWDCSGPEVKLVGDSGSQPGSVDRLALAVPKPGHLVTAVRHGRTERLELAMWDMAPDSGLVTPIGAPASTDVRIDSLSLVATGPDQLVTAVKIQGCSRLKLVSWSINADTLELSGDNGVQGDKVEAAAHALVSLGQGMLATAIRKEASDTARVAIWCVESGSRAVTLLGYSGDEDGAVTHPCLVATGAESAVLVTRTGKTGRMMLINWEFKK